MTLEQLSAIVRADPDQVPKLRYSEKLRRIELAGKYHHLFTEQIEVTQSVDLNTLVEVRAAVHAVVQAEHISECDAALRLAEQLTDVPELAATLREWAAGSARQQTGPRGNTITDDAVDGVLLETLAIAEPQT